VASTVAATATVGLSHLAANRIGFDHPANWQQATLPPGGVPNFGGLTFVGTAPSTGGCHSTGTNSTTCSPDFALTPGTVSVAVYWLDGPMTVDPFSATSQPAPDDLAITVDGVPALRSAIHRSNFQGGGQEETLTLPGPVFEAPPIFVVADFLGPGDDALRGAIDALFASVHYEPELTATAGMGTAAASRAAQAGIDKLREIDTTSGSGPCYRLPGGAVRAATLTAFPLGPALSKPLPVSCTTAIEGTPVEVWKFVVTYTWQAAADRVAGSASLLTWVSTAGDAWPSERTGDEPPYQH
jgi:hypothetical protein